ncbi:hypothetical protein TAGGR_3119 [Thermodesulfovibrio aggregans]|uniref:DUF3782 domain-containing protein n=1 Tax=Thermodesulfovibrio aggregans TaxID=86166 RepID=A0A0U9HRI8_9BACT|nr:DUF3782 domain-containing protein [Thermodesulfovibrio aggregans]GAQ95646.1 hypothetical protein TAGGR_3119 [Thermodesulfovibrio aggregans]
MTSISLEEIKKIIKTELPSILKTDPSFRKFILQITKSHYPPKKKTEDRIEQLYQQILQMQEQSEKRWQEWIKRYDQTQAEWNKKWEEYEKRWQEWNKKWEENEKRWKENQQKWEEWIKKYDQTQAEWNKKWEEYEKRWKENQQKWEEWIKRYDQTQAEWNKKWEENEKRWKENQQKWEEWIKRYDQTQAEWNKKWEENQKTINEILKRLEKIDRRHLYTIGALGARWGLYSEESFRNGLKAIIEDSFGVEVMRYVDYDRDGEVFGHPDQIELDLIIRNGMVIACEIKSSISKSDMYSLWRKKEFYEKKHQRKVDRVIVISPMVDPRAKPVAEKLGIEIYTHSDEFIENEQKSLND